MMSIESKNDGVNVWEIRISNAFVHRYGLENVKKSKKGLNCTLENMSDEDRKSIDENLIKTCKKFGLQSLFDFWERVIGLGYYKDSGGMVDFARDFYTEVAASVNYNRPEIERCQARETKKKGLFGR